MDVYNIKDMDLLSYVDPLRNIMIDISRICEFNVVEEIFHQFNPIGVTGCFVLAESHFAIHTFPERNAMAVDIYCCTSSFDDQLALKTCKEKFGGDIEYQIIDRLR